MHQNIGPTISTSQNQKFSWEGHCPLPNPSNGGERNTPSHIPPPSALRPPPNLELALMPLPHSDFIFSEIDLMPHTLVEWKTGVMGQWSSHGWAKVGTCLYLGHDGSLGLPKFEGF